MKILTFKLKLLAAIIVGFAIIGGQLFAVPAPNRPVQLEQPDGSTVTVLIHGDERNSWISTTDGYSVARNPQGFFEYVQRIDRDAILVLSGIRMAPNVQQRSDAEKTFLQSISKHLRVTPLPQPKEEAQKSQGSDPSGARNWLMHRPNNHDVFSKRGRFKSIVVPVHFADFPLTYSQAEIDSALNAENYTGHGCKGSVRDYFHDMSGGQFTPEFLVLPPYTAQHNRVGYYAYGDPYSSGSTEGIELKLEVYYYVNAVLRERALEEFDGNGDGIIDHISIIFAGQGQELTGNIGMIWSNHSWRYTSGSLRPINYIHFTAVSEIDNFNDRLGIATYCHEFGHTLGLPDFYDTDNETNGFADHPDDHDLMSSNTGTGHPVGMSAVSRFALGWLNLKTVGTAASISLPDVTGEKQALRINTGTAGEFFVLENRQNAKWNEPGIYEGHGLLVFRVDSAYYQSNLANNKINANAAHLGVAVVRADNNSEYSTQAGDYFPAGMTSFTDATTPSMQSLAGVNTAKPITSISENSGTISFQLMGGGNTLTVSTHAIQPTGNGKVTVSASVLPCGTETVTERGVCYGLLPTPLVSGNKVIADASDNNFSAEITGLTPGTTYYARAYANNSGGTAVYGAAKQFTAEAVVKVTTEYGTKGTIPIFDISEMQNPIVEIYKSRSYDVSYDAYTLPVYPSLNSCRIAVELVDKQDLESGNYSEKISFELPEKSDYYRIVANSFSGTGRDSLVIKEKPIPPYATLPYSKEYSTKTTKPSSYVIAPSAKVTIVHLNTLSAVNPVLYLNSIHASESTPISVRYKTANGTYRYLNLTDENGVDWRKATPACAIENNAGVRNNYNDRDYFAVGTYLAKLPKAADLTLYIERASAIYAFDSDVDSLPVRALNEERNAKFPIEVAGYSGGKLRLRVWYKQADLANATAQGICWSSTSTTPTITDLSEYVEGEAQEIRYFTIDKMETFYIRPFVMTEQGELTYDNFQQISGCYASQEMFLEKTVTLPYNFVQNTDNKYWKRNANLRIYNLSEFDIFAPENAVLMNNPDTLFLQSPLIVQKGTQNPQVLFTLDNSSGNYNDNMNPVTLYAVNENTGVKTRLQQFVPTQSKGRQFAVSTVNCGDSIRLRFEFPLLTTFAFSQFEIKDNAEFMVNAPAIERKDATTLQFSSSYQPEPMLPEATEFGFIWSSERDPLNLPEEQRNTLVAQLQGDSAFTANLPWDEITRFHTRAYVKNSDGYSYSDLVSETVCGKYIVRAESLPVTDNKRIILYNADASQMLLMAGECIDEHSEGEHTFYFGQLELENRPQVNKIKAEFEIVALLYSTATSYEAYKSLFTFEYRLMGSSEWLALPAAYCTITFVSVTNPYYIRDCNYSAELHLPRNVEQIRVRARELPDEVVFTAYDVMGWRYSGGPGDCTYSQSTLADIGCTPPAIDALTVESGHLQIQWGVSDKANLTKVRIYRESTTAGVFTMIQETAAASINANQTYSYNDAEANPDSRAYKYKVVAVNAENTEFASLPHKSVHLSINKGINDQWNLYWTPYEGLSVSTMRIYRGSSPNTLTYLNEVPGSNNTFTDVSAPAGTNYYVVEAVFAEPQAVAAAKIQGKNLASSRSNVVNNSGSNGLETELAQQFHIYPNPTTSVVNIDNPLNSEIEVYTSNGVLIKRTKGKRIDLSRQPAGVYLLKLGNKTARVIKK